MSCEEILVQVFRPIVLQKDKEIFHAVKEYRKSIFEYRAYLTDEFEQRIEGSMEELKNGKLFLREKYGEKKGFNSLEASLRFLNPGEKLFENLGLDLKKLRKEIKNLEYFIKTPSFHLKSAKTSNPIVEIIALIKTYSNNLDELYKNLELFQMSDVNEFWILFFKNLKKDQKIWQTLNYLLIEDLNRRMVVDDLRKFFEIDVKVLQMPFDIDEETKILIRYLINFLEGLDLEETTKIIDTLSSESGFKRGLLTEVYAEKIISEINKSEGKINSIKRDLLPFTQKLELMVQKTIMDVYNRKVKFIDAFDSFFLPVFLTVYKKLSIWGMLPTFLIHRFVIDSFSLIFLTLPLSGLISYMVFQNIDAMKNEFISKQDGLWKLTKISLFVILLALILFHDKVLEILNTDGNENKVLN